MNYKNEPNLFSFYLLIYCCLFCSTAHIYCCTYSWLKMPVSLSTTFRYANGTQPFHSPYKWTGYWCCCCCFVCSSHWTANTQILGYWGKSISTWMTSFGLLLCSKTLYMPHLSPNLSMRCQVECLCENMLSIHIVWCAFVFFSFLQFSCH